MLNICFRDVGNTEFIAHHNKYNIFGSLLSAAGSIFGGSVAKVL